MFQCRIMQKLGQGFAEHFRIAAPFFQKKYTKISLVPTMNPDVFAEKKEMTGELWKFRGFDFAFVDIFDPLTKCLAKGMTMEFAVCATFCLKPFQIRGYSANRGDIIEYWIHKITDI